MDRTKINAFVESSGNTLYVYIYTRTSLRLYSRYIIILLRLCVRITRKYINTFRPTDGEELHCTDKGVLYSMHFIIMTKHIHM